MKYMYVKEGGSSMALVGYADHLSASYVREKILKQVRSTQMRLGSTMHIYDLRKLEKSGEVVVIAEHDGIDELRLPHLEETQEAARSGSFD